MVEKHPWNDYSRVYAQSIEQLTFPMAVILFNSLNINEATNVLEVGTGNGQNLEYYIQQKPQACYWHATDVSETMLSICQQRIEEFLINPIKRVKHNYLTEEIPKFVEKTIPKINVSFQQANAQNLSQFETNAFDRYMAVLVLGYKIDQQEQMLQEALRVVKSGGLLGFAVFGRRENSPFQNLYKEIAIEQGVDRNKFPPDIFDSTNKEKLIARMEKIGYKVLKSFYVCFPINNYEKKVEAYLAEGSMKRQVLISAGASNELIEKITQMTIEKFQEYEIEKKAPITMETLFIIAEK